jgi:hypothetical protein
VPPAQEMRPGRSLIVDRPSAPPDVVEVKSEGEWPIVSPNQWELPTTSDDHIMGVITRGRHRLGPYLVSFAVALGAVAVSETAEAQYKGNQFGVEAGYFFLGEDAFINQHNPGFGLRGAFKTSDHWWLTARGLVSFAGDQLDNSRTVFLLYIEPIAGRYYFETDAVRPFVGISNQFIFLFNRSVGGSVMWGPGGQAGIEFRIARDLFLGFQADAYYMVAFEGNNIPTITVNSQIIWFL